MDLLVTTVFIVLGVAVGFGVGLKVGHSEGLKQGKIAEQQAVLEQLDKVKLGFIRAKRKDQEII